MLRTVLNEEKHPNRVICPKCGKPGTKRRQMIRCGRLGCPSCPHGPYWYVAHRIGNKVVSCYIGKTWPRKEEKMDEGKASMVTVRIPKGELEKFDDLVKKKPHLQMWRLKKRLTQAMAELDRLSDKVYIPPPIKENAAVIYRKALDKGLVHGRSIAAIAAAALYAACRESGTLRTLREIADASPVDKKDVTRCYRLLLRELDMQMPIADPLTYISKIAEMMGISGKTQEIAIQILRKAQRTRVSAGKDPMGLAAAALYIACLQNDEKKTQKDIAEAAGVTEVTVRNRYKTLKNQLNLDVRIVPIYDT